MRTLWCIVLAGLAAACTYEGEEPNLDGQDVHLTFLHTADWHSRLVPYDFTVGQVDENLGLVQENGPFGGAARMSYLLSRERARSARVLHLDSGDVFQGAPIFNYFYGEAEMRALSESGLDAMVIGNHEFDAGGENFARQVERWATFPVLAANYLYEPPDEDDYFRQPRLGRLAQPYTILNTDGLRVAVIGMGNLSSMNTIFEQPNRLGIIPLETNEIAQFYIDLVRPHVDLVVMLTHLGLSADERMIRNTSGIDVVLGGHLHIVLDPPKVLDDCGLVDESGQHYIEIYDGTETTAPPTRRNCTPRPVVLAHSGAFMKFLGRLDVVLSNDAARLGREPGIDGFEVLSHRYEIFPLDSTVPEDPRVAEMLEPYAQQIENVIDLDLLVGYAPTTIRRFGSQGGDSPLGNLISDAMWLRLGIQTDFALTNTTGIRTDLVPGAVSVEQMFNVFPFDNTVSKMFISGREVQELFDFVARRSASRGCNSQAQIAGARVVIDCSGTSEACGGEPCASTVSIGRSNRVCSRDADCQAGELCDRRPGVPAENWRCLLPLVEEASYELATNNYIAAGGSGFRVLQRNTTQIDTLLPQRDVLTDYIRNGPACGADRDTGELPSCSIDADCAATVGDGFMCACDATEPEWDEIAEVCIEPAGGASCGGNGRCILRSCQQAVEQFHLDRQCSGAIDVFARSRCECDARADSAEECKFLACITDDLGAVTDGRLRMVAF